MKILVTGGMGFIGSCFIRHMLANYDYEIINLDALTYAGNKLNLQDLENDLRLTFVHGDIADESLVNELMPKVDAVINFAAESHVDNSIKDPNIFYRTNVFGTLNLLNHARKYQIQRFIQISTDEVYGSIDHGLFTETSNLEPSSPYSSSKASADLLTLSFYKTYGMDVIVTRCTNNYGPYQFPEKLIPLFISLLSQGLKVPVYGSGANIRDWLYVYDHARAIDLVLHKGRAGEVYNIGSNNEKTNLEITQILLDTFGLDNSHIEHVADRLGHDQRYALDYQKIKTELGFTPSMSFKDGILETINWYKQNQDWVNYALTKDK